MPPPPAEPLASRLFLGPALRTQPDRRLVKLVREGYEGAFEEIVRRYRKPLDRFAAAIVGNRFEDVTQDAFSKALLALRGTEAEIELRPWLYRIVRNTALNDLRDAPPAAEELGEALAGGQSAAVEAERHEEITELIERLRALPEPQRAAIVMRELEGLSHEEIAAALGVSGGAARQAIYRARLALRDGLGLLVPLPFLRMLFDHGAEAAAAGAGGAAAAAGVATAGGGGGGAALGGLGAGGALKAGVATALVAGSVGAGVAVQQERDGKGTEPAAATAAQAPGGSEASGSGGSAGSSGPGSGSEAGDDRSGGGSGPGGDDREDAGGRHSDDRGDDSPGRGRGRGRGGDDDSSRRSSDAGSDDRGDDSSGSDSSGPGSGSTAPSPAAEPPDDDFDDDSIGSGSSGSGSSDDDLDSSGSGSDDD